MGSLTCADHQPIFVAVEVAVLLQYFLQVQLFLPVLASFFYQYSTVQAAGQTLTPSLLLKICQGCRTFSNSLFIQIWCHCHCSTSNGISLVCFLVTACWRAIPNGNHHGGEVALCQFKLCSKRGRAVTLFPLAVLLVLAEDGEEQGPC